MFSKSKDNKAVNSMVGSTSRSDRPARTAGAATPSIIGADVRIMGNISTIGEVQVDGEIEGDLQCGNLTMGEQGSVTGSVEADSAIIKGRIEGKIRAKKIRLEKTAVLLGDVYHESLSVEAGAQLSGQVIHASQEGTASGAKAKAANADEEQTVKAVG